MEVPEKSRRRVFGALLEGPPRPPKATGRGAKLEDGGGGGT